MTKTRQWKNRGAPLRVFFLIIAFWVFGRVLWEGYLPVQMGTQNLTADARDGFSIKVAKSNITKLFGQVSDRLSFEDRRNAIPSVAQSGGSNVFVTNKNPRVEIKRISKIVGLKRSSNKGQQLALFQQKRNFGLIEHGSFVVPKTTQQASTLNAYRMATVQMNETPKMIRTKKLSGYIWTFARQGSARLGSSSVATPSQPGGGQYGGSQAGAILVLKVSGSNQNGLSVFSRVSSPLAVRGEEELAVGAMAKPFNKIPVSIYAEQRFGRDSRLNRGTAIYVAGGAGPEELIKGTSLETYGQAGFVSGRQSTYFFDGSAIIQKQLLGQGRKKLTVGGGIWAGGQKGVSRLDVGPRLNFDVPIGDLATRISVDWRQRVAGNAEPNSGLAVTVSTGF